MIDIDWFKAFNDCYGHQAGDKCLFEIAQLLAAETETAGGVVARYGGEEFIILLTNTSHDDALLFAKQLGELAKSFAIPHRKSPKGIITLSLGVASHNPKLGDNLDKLVHAADSALYNAKNNGRDQVSE